MSTYKSGGFSPFFYCDRDGRREGHSLTRGKIETRGCSALCLEARLRAHQSAGARVYAKQSGRCSLPRPAFPDFMNGVIELLKIGFVFMGTRSLMLLSLTARRSGLFDVRVFALAALFKA